MEFCIINFYPNRNIIGQLLLEETLNIYLFYQNCKCNNSISLAQILLILLK